MPFFTLLFLLASSVAAAHHWESQHFHDVDQEEMSLSSIGFCSPTHGVAVGMLSKRGSVKPIAMVTSNGGKTWTQTPVEEPGHSVFFLDETSGWMLTASGIWFTDECGRNWRRIHKQRNLTQVRFISRERGWAVGAGKTAIETSDGGKTWTKIKAVAALEVSPERTTFHVIEPMPPKSALIIGRSTPPRRMRLPVWLDPEPERRRELPALSLSLDTQDAGATWKASTVSMFGRISAVRWAKKGQSILLVEFDEFFEFPSELYAIDNGLAKNTRSLRLKDLAVTDVAVAETPEGSEYFAAGFQPPGALFRTPVPGKVRILHSRNLTDWSECQVDYRAVATRVTMAQSGGRVWVATDTGMILSLVRD